MRENVGGRARRPAHIRKNIFAAADLVADAGLSVGFVDFKRELVPALEGVPEMGWALKPSVHGRGYASEALGAMIQWGDVNLKSERTACIIHPDNRPSLALAAKFGFQWERDVRHQDVAVKLFFRPRPNNQKL